MISECKSNAMHFFIKYKSQGLQMLIDSNRNVGNRNLILDKVYFYILCFKLLLVRENMEDISCHFLCQQDNY